MIHLKRLCIGTLAVVIMALILWGFVALSSVLSWFPAVLIFVVFAYVLGGSILEG